MLMTFVRVVAALAFALLPAGGVAAQEVPDRYQPVLKTLGKSGDYKDGVLKVNIPRSDVRVTIGGRPAPTPFGFGGWLAFTQGDGGHDVMMGDLVLTEDEVNPVMSAVLANGLDVTALHNHFFWDAPRMYFMHVHGMGPAGELASKMRPAIDIINTSMARAATPTATASAAAGLDTTAVATAIGHPGEQNGPVFKITIGRPDIPLREHGALINARMGLNTWAAFAGTDADAMVAGDVAMTDREVTPVLKALREGGLQAVALHHHMTGVAPTIIFVHYYGTGPAPTLAKAVRSAIDVLGRR